MQGSEDANWWLFAIDPQRRGDKIGEGEGGGREVNPPLPDGRLLLDYGTYIGLERLLSCQVPGSLVPDERAFIVTHQLFELAFKLMIFDLAVVSETCAHLLGVADRSAFRDLCLTADDPFWHPALTASGRLRYGAASVLPALTGYLANRSDGVETFNSLEFGKFRPNLVPASGFQSSQFRLIQRGLGKAHLLPVRLFPAATYWANYEGGGDRGPASVVDPVILRAGAAVADPPADSPLVLAARLDDHAHRLLARFRDAGKTEGGEPAIRLITRSEVEEAVAAFRRILTGQRSLQERGGQKPADAEEKDRTAAALFRADLEKAARWENGRRGSLAAARAGALQLRREAPRGSLARVLDHLLAADAALHGEEEGSFLSLHLRLVAGRIGDLAESARKAGEPEPPRGTGGGGIPYLGFARSHLIPLFPALVACLDPAGRNTPLP
jgi:tryptophan 2,3-dioxygenase